MRGLQYILCVLLACNEYACILLLFFSSPLAQSVSAQYIIPDKRLGRGSRLGGENKKVAGSIYLEDIGRGEQHGIETSQAQQQSCRHLTCVQLASTLSLFRPLYSALLERLRLHAVIKLYREAAAKIFNSFQMLLLLCRGYKRNEGAGRSSVMLRATVRLCSPARKGHSLFEQARLPRHRQTRFTGCMD